MDLDVLGEVIAGAVLFIVSGIAAYTFKFFKERKKMISDNNNAIDELNDKVDELSRLCKYDALRVRKAIMILSKRLDKKNKEIHPDIDTAFEEITKDILTDDY